MKLPLYSGQNNDFRRDILACPDESYWSPESNDNAWRCYQVRIPAQKRRNSVSTLEMVMRAAEETTSNNVFPFKLVHISKKHRTWFFSASSEDERKDWMASLRREIDHYHEKKEVITDLSDSSSDVDSFYGSVEQPINIHYSRHSMENSDYDQDEYDEYVHPDNSDCVKCEDHIVFPPTYPPPPIPPMGKPSYSEKKAHSFSGKCGVAVLPVPSLKKSLPDVRHEVVLSVTGELPFHNMSPQSTCQQVIGQSPPVPLVKKPTCLTEISSSPAVSVPLFCVLPTAEECQKLKEFKLSPQAPPPLPNSKPKLSQYPVNSLMNTQAPRKQGKPGLLTPKVLAKSQVPGNKPPVPTSKPEKPLLAYLGSSSPRRSSPDGQSFRVAFEKPALPSKSNLSGEDSDGDYEKIELPNSVFVNTSESLEVERMFKSENPMGHPKHGLFCIRNSSKKTGKVLVVWDESVEKVRNYRIFQQDSKFYLEADILFLSLRSLVEHYSSHVLPSHSNLILQFPYGYSGPR
ncbi:SH3 domain-binding protein 2 isoform X2 [Rhineura floridana]|uniref:SH3 domain-binding protein 2 isoform X2 n=1 Tax=Rhineura floridana TaxID=261503 RepID=UPI002AC810C2|nr:SH3 domain-binding protein 2 isoform X2 [Rhineura floridana]